MLKEIGSNQPTFKTLRFRPGLNLILAEKHSQSDKRDTRNGAGKTSIIEIVNFLFGSNCPKLFKNDFFKEYSFSTKFDYNDKDRFVSRSCSAPNRVTVDNKVKSLDEWKKELGLLFFQLEPEQVKTFGPTFRSLFSYFVRNDNQQGFAKTTQYSTEQQSWNEQVSLSYLLGLNWKISTKFQEVREKNKSLAQLKKIMKSGDIGQLPKKKAAQLKTELTGLQDELQKLRENIGNFQVVPQYLDLQREADSLTNSMGRLSIDNVADQELITQLKKSIEDEQPVPFQDILNLYKEAEIIFPDTIKKRFEDVKIFHNGIITNRRNHLQNEIETAEQRINQREEQLKNYDNRRREIMKILETGGALEQFSLLQAELSQKEALTNSLEQQYKLAKEIDQNKSDILIEKTELKQALTNDINERDEIVKEAIISFRHLSQLLYNKPGSLTINPTENGLMFDVHIDSEGSKGIKNMQTFCFDMMLTEIGLRYNRHPGFLIHDSHLFDGVDKRQIARALQIGAKLSKKWNFQYIVTLNSDTLPIDEFDKDFDIRPYKIDVELTDEENGGLFGERFKTSD